MQDNFWQHDILKWKKILDLSRHLSNMWQVYIVLDYEFIQSSSIVIVFFSYLFLCISNYEKFK